MKIQRVKQDFERDSENKRNRTEKTISLKLSTETLDIKLNKIRQQEPTFPLKAILLKGAAARKQLQSLFVFWGFFVRGVEGGR